MEEENAYQKTDSFAKNKRIRCVEIEKIFRFIRCKKIRYLVPLNALSSVKILRPPSFLARGNKQTQMLQVKP